MCSTTAWSIVFCPLEQIILFKTHKNKSIRKLKLADFNFEKKTDYLLMNINDGSEDRADQFFKPYSKELNQNIVRQAAKSFSLPESKQVDLVNLIDSLYINREMSLD